MSPFIVVLQQQYALFAALSFNLCMQTGMVLPNAANRHANAKSGEKKRRREDKLSLKGEKIPAIPGSK